MYSEFKAPRAQGVGRPDDPAISLNLGEVTRFYRRSWKAISLVATASMVVAAIIAVKLAPLYTSTAQVIIERPSASPVGEELLLGGSYDSSFIDSQVSVLSSTQLLRRVVESAALQEDPEFIGDEAPSLVSRVRDYLFLPVVALGLVNLKPDEQPEASVDMTTRAVQSLKRAINVSREGKSYVIAISVTSGDPIKAAALANSVAEAYMSEHIDLRYDQAKRASNWLTERMAVLQDQLKSAEDAVEDFKIKHNLLATKSGTLTEQQLSELNLQLIGVRAELAQKRATFDQARTLLRAGGDIQSIPQVLDSPVITGLREQHSDVTRREADLLSRYGERHPQVINVRAERAAVERHILAEVERIIGNLANEVQIAETREASLALSLAQATGQTGVDNQVSIQLRELERIANANQTLYEGFLSRAGLLEDETSFRSSGIRVINWGVAPEDPSFPPKKIIVLFGLMIGLGLGTFGALARELLHDGFATARQAEEILNLPILASIPKMLGSNLPVRHDGRSSMPLLFRTSVSPFNEAVRTLRHALLMDMESGKTPVVQITSAIVGEGKTTVAISLAASAAGAGYRVLIIDTDLRRSGLTRHLGMTGDLGLVDLIAGTPTDEQAIQLDEKSGIYVLPAGARTMNPSDLLDSARMRLFLEWARKSFDLIILDSPPVADMADARILSRHADAVAFIVKWNSTPREAVSHSLHRLDRSKIKGLAINMVDERKIAGYGEYYGHYAEPHAAADEVGRIAVIGR